MTGTREAEVGALLAGLLKLDDAGASQLRRADIPQWDSLKHMEIVFVLEDRYGVRFDEAEFAALDSTTAIAAALARHRAP